MTDTGPFRSIRYAETGRSRRAGRRLALALAAVLVLLGLGAVGLWAFANARIDATSIAGLDPAPDAAPTNVLVALTPGTAEPADGLALVQLRAGAPAVLVLPTALELEVPDVGTRSLRGVHGEAGMPLLVDAVESWSGLDVHHVAELDAASLAAAIDANGGLADCPSPDAQACPVLTGGAAAAALAPPDGAVSGAERVRAAADVLRLIGIELSRPATVLDPRRVARWSGAWQAAVRTDVDPGAVGLLELAGQLATIEPDVLDVRIVPGLVEGDRITATPEETAVLLAAFADGSTLPDVGVAPPRELVPSDVTVAVRNGAGIAGIAGETADRLRAAGFEVADVGNADRFDQRAPTRVGYVEDDLPLAELVAQRLGDAEVEQLRTPPPPGVDVVVTVGRPS